MKKHHFAELVQKLGEKVGEKHENENEFQQIMLDNGEYVMGLMSDEAFDRVLTAIGCNAANGQSPTAVPSEESFEVLKTLSKLELCFIISMARCGFTEFSIMRTLKMAKESAKRN